MGPAKVMLIRHAEKPDGTGRIVGVDETGQLDPNQLSVRGWQRAGALVRYFAPIGKDLTPGIATPTAIFACRPANSSSSLRPLSTVMPLASALQIPVRNEIGKGDGHTLPEAISGISGAVLICWSHDEIPAIARRLAGDLPGLPDAWPRKRYDLVWILDRSPSGWSFFQAGQLLLPEDAGAP